MHFQYEAWDTDCNWITSNMITSFADVHRNGGVKDSVDQAQANSNLVLHQAGSCHEEVGQWQDATFEVLFFCYSRPLHLVHLFQPLTGRKHCGQAI